jgi:hypothetical protein
LNPTSTQANIPTFTLLLLTSPVQAGANATVQIQTSAGATCFLSYTTPAGTDSTAKGLGVTTADGNGVCSWTWEIGSSTKSGTGRLAITVDGKTQFLDIIIQ